MSEYAVTITCKLNETDKTLTTFVLDTVSDTSIDSRISLTSHPLANGTIVSDHLYKEQDTLNLSGTFSLNGSKGIIVDGGGARLENIEQLFEKIKDEGILCEIVKIHVVSGESGNNEARFKRRSNMVLTNIGWTERINSLDFNFTFTQVMLVDIQELDVDIDDKYLPNVTEPSSLSFTDTLIDWEQVDKLVIDELSAANLITKEFIQYMSSMTATSLVALGVGLSIAAIVVHIPFIGKVAAVLSVAIIVVGGLANWIKGVIDRHKYRQQQFKLYQDDKKNKEEVQRFCNFVGEVHNHIELLNDSIKLYGFASNEQQECMVTISNNYYIFTISRNNSNNTYDLNVTDVNENVVSIKNNISSAISNISQCTLENSLFRASETGEYVYILCADEDKSDLTNYFILVSEIDMSKFNEVLGSIITNALVY